MDDAAGTREPSIESEFARMVRLLDLYVRQKTDLFLQHYVFEPFYFLSRQLMYLAVVLTLLAAGTTALVAGLVLFLETLVPLWAALLIMAVLVFAAGGVIASMLFSNTIVLNTGTAAEMINRGKP